MGYSGEHQCSVTVEICWGNAQFSGSTPVLDKKVLFQVLDIPFACEFKFRCVFDAPPIISGERYDAKRRKSISAAIKRSWLGPKRRHHLHAVATNADR